MRYAPFRLPEDLIRKTDLLLAAGSVLAPADATPLRHHATADYITIGDWGMVVGRDANIEMAAAHYCDVKSYEQDDWQLHRLSEKAVILTYEAEQDGECDGMKIAEDEKDDDGTDDDGR